jgi:hypothetical protein
MMIMRLLGPAGIAGLAASLCLALLLVVQKGETRHWKKEAGQFEQLYRENQAAFAGTVANVRAAAEAARAADRANAARVESQQHTINDRSEHELESRLADARARARELRDAAEGPADPGAGRNAPVPGLSAAAGGTAQAAGEVGLSPEDSLTATEQAIQLDELIRWVKAQAAIDTSAKLSSSATPSGDPR